ncbi:MAG: hypothetical protein ACLSGI_12470 [Butyricicoccaceae bacterium]
MLPAASAVVRVSIAKYQEEPTHRMVSVWLCHRHNGQVVFTQSVMAAETRIVGRLGLVVRQLAAAISAE